MLKGGYSVKLRGRTVQRLDTLKKEIGGDLSYNRIIEYLLDEHRRRGGDSLFKMNGSD